MKLIDRSKILNYAIVILCVSIINSTVMKNLNTIKTHAHDTPCENPCQVCQKTVYQMKFQKFADCDFSNTCKGTCYKIKENWGNNWSPFEPFTKDLFGKCEICFRAGYCSITECKDQEAKELDIINTIINTSTLTAKIDDSLLKNLPGLSKASNIDIKQIAKNNKAVMKKLEHEIRSVMSTQDSQDIVPQVQSLIKSYFSEPFEPVTNSVDEIFEAHLDIPTSEISYWNTEKSNKDLVDNRQRSDQLVKQVDEQLDVIEKAKESKDKSIKKQVRKAAEATSESLKKVDKEYTKKEKKIEKDLKKIEKMLRNDDLEGKARADLENSASKIKEVKTNIESIRNEIKQLEQKAKKF